MQKRTIKVSRRSVYDGTESTPHTKYSKVRIVSRQQTNDETPHTSLENVVQTQHRPDIKHAIEKPYIIEGGYVSKVKKTLERKIAYEKLAEEVIMRLKNDSASHENNSMIEVLAAVVPQDGFPTTNMVSRWTSMCMLTNTDSKEIHLVPPPNKILIPVLGHVELEIINEIETVPVVIAIRIKNQENTLFHMISPLPKQLHITNGVTHTTFFCDKSSEDVNVFLDKHTFSSVDERTGRNNRINSLCISKIVLSLNNVHTLILPASWPLQIARYYNTYEEIETAYKKCISHVLHSIDAPPTSKEIVTTNRYPLESISISNYSLTNMITIVPSQPQNNRNQMCLVM